MKEKAPFILVFIKRFLILMLLFSISRVLFFCENTSFFSSNKISENILCFVSGLRFDLSGLLSINLPSLLLILIAQILYWTHPVRLENTIRWTVKIENIYFYAINASALILNFIDIYNFKYMLKRIGFNIMFFFRTGDGAFNILLSGIVQYWWGLILFGVFIWGWMYVNKKFSSYHIKTLTLKKPSLLYIATLVTFIIGISVVAVRGGFQLRPLSVVSAIEGDNPNNAQLVMNSPFCFLQAMMLPTVKNKKYMSDAEAKNTFNPIFTPRQNTNAEKKNLCIIIVESLSWEALEMGGNKKKSAHFLDSLANYSTVFKRMYANGKQSIDGIPAILSGFPGLMDEPYLTSTYASNQLTSIASLLKPQGYHSSFFHGGKTGTMNFDKYTQAVGFDKYYGKEDFPDQGQFDGNWGIWDKPFLQFYADKLDKMPKPFVSSVFTLSSHPPYAIPKNEMNIYNDLENPFLNTIHYTDDALQLFFDKIKNTDWYHNTRFVIVADHIGELGGDKGRKELYHIPCMIFDPQNPVGYHIYSLAQQTDILPVLCERYGINHNILSWSNYNKENSFSINYMSSSYQLIMGNSVLISDGETVLNYYNDTTDLLNHTQAEMLKFMQAYIQQYNMGILENKLVWK